MKLTRGDSSVLEPLQSQWSRGGADTRGGGELARPEVRLLADGDGGDLKSSA